MVVNTVVCLPKSTSPSLLESTDFIWGFTLRWGLGAQEGHESISLTYPGNSFPCQQVAEDSAGGRPGMASETLPGFSGVLYTTDKKKSTKEDTPLLFWRCYDLMVYLELPQLSPTQSPSLTSRQRPSGNVKGARSLTTSLAKTLTYHC